MKAKGVVDLKTGQEVWNMAHCKVQWPADASEAASE